MQRCIPLCALALSTIGFLPAVDFPWQDPHAEVLPNGDLALKQEPFVFQAGDTIRYIDYENGDDAAAGTRDAPWKHHPWDAAAAGAAAGHDGPTTYVFKGGVTYRGSLKVDEAGTAAEPIRLTRDPDWGDGEARIYGSRQITGGWQQGADHADIPDGEEVWWIDLDTDPRCAWVVDGDDVQRLHIARDPNWTVSNPHDSMSEWYVWDNPQWWEGKNKKKIDGKPYHWCTDTDVLKGGDNLTGATVWTQWMPVMSSPYPHPIIEHDRGEGAVAFGGPWVPHASSAVWEGCRYYLEDRPQWLDSAGEMWFDKQGDGGRLYVRLPGDANPNQAVIEIAERLSLIEAEELRHVHISGLSFRFTDWFYDFPGPSWADPAKNAAAIWVRSAGEEIRIEHCAFHHVQQPIRIDVASGQRADEVVISDNRMHHVDQGAIRFTHTAANPKRGTDWGVAEGVSILRNDIADAGMRVMAGEHGHVVQIAARDVHIAGNVLDHLGGAGIHVTGGHNTAGIGEQIDFSRFLIHHNKVSDSLLQSCDWGAFYQHSHSGPAYFWSNVADNPVGNRRTEDGRLGMAYYLDGAYKCYLFNNIAIGADHQGDEKLMNKNALKSMVSFQNTVFNNTVFRWANASDRQSPQGNREKYIGNVFSNIGEWVFHHNKAQDDAAAANAHHEVHADAEFRYETMAYSDNVIHDVHGGNFGVFEQKGLPYTDIESMRQALADVDSLVSDIGVLAEEPPLVDPENGDFRPRPDGAAIDRAAQVFVPWPLARTVAEWHFRSRADEPTIIEDEHWYQTAYYIDRGMYRTTPRYPLVVDGATRADFTTGPLEDWIPGALVLDEAGTAVLSQAHIAEPFTHGTGNRAKGPEHTVQAEDKQTVDIHDSDLLIECHLRTSDNGILVRKMAGGIGYSLSLIEGQPKLVIRDQKDAFLEATGIATLADDAWHHLVVEVDRDEGVRMYVDGDVVAVEQSAVVPAGSLRNDGDFTVGGATGHDGLAVELEFLRLARATLEAANTTIEELHAWQFDGPQFRDFAGRPHSGLRRDAGALEAE